MNIALSMLPSEGFWRSIAALALALALGAGLILAIGQDPLAAYNHLIFGSFTSLNNALNLVAILTPLLVTSAAVTLSFKSGVFNIGIEGQLFMGAFAAALAAAYLPLPGPVLIVAALAAGALGGAAWGFVPAYLRSVYGVSEIVSTIMLNYVAILFTQYLVTYPFNANVGYAATRLIAADAWLPAFTPFSTANVGIFIALACCLLIAFALSHTAWGQEVKFAGANPRFAESIGVPVLRRAFEAMMAAGALAGIAGALLVLGVFHRFIAELSPGYGYVAITIALLARLSPLAVIPAALVYALMMNGAGIMQQQVSVPYPLVTVLQGVLIIFVTAEGLLWWSRRNG